MIKLKDKIKEFSEIVEEIEKLLIKIISLVGWIIILIEALKSCRRSINNSAMLNYSIKLTICQDMKKIILVTILRLFELLGLVFALTALITFIMNEMG